MNFGIGTSVTGIELTGWWCLIQAGNGNGTMVHLNINPFLLKLSISGMLATLKPTFVPCRSGSVPL
jgi:hypothetical protein